MKRRKILFAARRYLPEIGGVELHIQQVIAELGSADEVTVVAEQDAPGLSESEKIGKTLIYRIPLPNYHTQKWSIWKWWVHHWRLIFEADIIHIHDVFFWFLPFRLFFFWKKFYITFHGYEGVGNPKVKQQFWHQLAEVCTEGNLCIGGFHQKWYGVSPTIVSFGAVDSAILDRQETSRVVKAKKMKNANKTEDFDQTDHYSLPSANTIQIVFVGRLAADTGILVYLAALGGLQKTHNVNLDIFGDGPDSLLVKKYIAEHDLSATMHGFVDQAEISWGKYQLAFVSRYLAILESFMAGVPVVAQYNVEIKRDYLELSPFKDWLITSATADEVEEATTWWLNGGNEANQKIWQAKAWASKQSWQQMTMNYQQLWQ